MVTVGNYLAINIENIFQCWYVKVDGIGWKP